MPSELPLGLDLTFHPDLSVPIDLGGDVELFPTAEDIELAGGARVEQPARGRSPL